MTIIKNKGKGRNRLSLGILKFLAGKNLNESTPVQPGTIYLDTEKNELWYDDPANENANSHTRLFDSTFNNLSQGISDNARALEDAINAYIKELYTTGSIINVIRGNNTLETFNTTFVGTRAEYQVAYAAGKIPVGTIVYITDEPDDDDEEFIPDAGGATSSKLGVGVLGYMILG